MNSTTPFPPIKVGKNQTQLPSGVVVSNDGRYRYFQCSISGSPTFAKKDYWVKIMAKFKTEENLIKTYVCRKAQKLLDEGKSQTEVIAILSGPVGKVKKEKKIVSPDTPGLTEKQKNKAIKAERKAALKKMRKPRSKGLKSFAIGKVEVEVLTESGGLVKEVVPEYPWQGDPTYFGSGGTSVIPIAEATKDSCAYPNRFLDGECKYCSAFSACSFAGKGTENKKAFKAIEKPLKSFDN